MAASLAREALFEFHDVPVIQVVQEYRFIDPAGRTRHIRDEKQVVARSEDGLPHEVIGTWTDLTDAYEQRAQVHALANYDARTGLPNRALLRERIEEAVADAQSQNRSCHVIFFDFDRFRRINETLGEAAGDQLLETVGARLNHAMAEFDTAARVGDHELIITASIGVANHPRGGDTPETLMSAAELAVGDARRAGGDQKLGESGVHIAMDDFRAIIALAAALELSLVAEGVETEAQKAFLSRERCQIGQEFLFARPAPAKELFPGSPASSSGH
ncbi:diguanylate cyclase domain-containing protein [Aquisalimonas sp. APHAB1-3]|uniref:diguanylate cyclase domain-containing protein n=1 Tax=unclassified Aquisalimonas TaxID=2644645 RepID=UPI0025C4B88F|nr:diguanylate cyclase [Aquisalimonas sp.]